MEELAENKTLLFDNVPWDVLAIYKLQPLARPPFLILAMQLNKPERAEQIYIWRKLLFISLHSWWNCINPLLLLSIHPPVRLSVSHIHTMQQNIVICLIQGGDTEEEELRKSCTRMALLSKLLNRSCCCRLQRNHNPPDKVPRHGPPNWIYLILRHGRLGIFDLFVFRLFRQLDFWGTNKASNYLISELNLVELCSLVWLKRPHN